MAGASILSRFLTLSLSPLSFSLVNSSLIAFQPPLYLKTTPSSLSQIPHLSPLRSSSPIRSSDPQFHHYRLPSSQTFRYSRLFGFGRNLGFLFCNGEGKRGEGELEQWRSFCFSFGEFNGGHRRRTWWSDANSAAAAVAEGVASRFGPPLGPKRRGRGNLRSCKPTGIGLFGCWDKKYWESS